MTHETPQEILTEAAETYERKNADYGESWYSIGEILFGLTKGEPITLETPEDFVSLGLFTRRMDKFARAFTGEFMSNDLNFESVQDSHEDEATYAAIHASLLAGQETVEYQTEHERPVDPAYEAEYQRRVNGD
jgi:hypothetical protein